MNGSQYQKLPLFQTLVKIQCGIEVVKIAKKRGKFSILELLLVTTNLDVLKDHWHVENAQMLGKLSILRIFRNTAVVTHNVNLMYYEGIKDTPFLFQ